MKEIIIAEIKRISGLLNKTPTRVEVLKYRNNLSITKNKINDIFGTYTDALIASELPLKIDNRNKGTQKVSCKTCNITFIKTNGEIKKSPNHFCSKSCAAITNNSVSKLKTGENVFNSYCCSQCNKSFTSTKNNLNKYITCSTPCWQEAEMKTKTMADVCKRSGSNTYDNIRKNARSYSKYIYKPVCSICKYDKHYEVCHVKALKDFSRNETLFEVNNKTNLVHLCPNCHWEFDHNLIPLETIIKAQGENLIKE